MWLSNGVHVSKDPVKKNDTLEITYAGLLRNSGATDVLAHCGYDGWDKVQDIWMSREPDGTFRCSTKASASREVNICFKDTANNWDNNNGWDWRVSVT